MEKQTSVGHLKSFFQSRSNICFIFFRFQYFDQVSDTWQCFLACLDTCIFFLDFYILTKCQTLGHFFCPVGFFIVSSFYTKFNVLSLKYTCLFATFSISFYKCQTLGMVFHSRLDPCPVYSDL